MHVFIYLYRQQAAQFSSARTRQQFRSVLDQISWTPDAVQDFNQGVLNGPQVTLCITNDSVSDQREMLITWLLQPVHDPELCKNVSFRLCSLRQCFSDLSYLLRCDQIRKRGQIEDHLFPYSHYL